MKRALRWFLFGDDERIDVALAAGAAWAALLFAILALATYAAVGSWHY